MGTWAARAASWESSSTCIALPQRRADWEHEHAKNEEFDPKGNIND